MHLAEEMVCKSTIIVKSAEVCAAYIADLKFLMSRRSRCVGESLQLALTIFFDLLLLPDPEVLRDSRVDTAELAQDRDLKEAVLYASRKFVDLFELHVLAR